MARKLKVNVDINMAVINRKAQKALDDYANALDPILDQQFRDEKWKWWTNTPTRRRNGTPAGNPRDIIDTGTLLNSKQGPTKKAPNKRLWVWNTPYAKYVKDGFMTTRGNIIPGRDWAKEAMRELPFAGFIARALRK